MMCRILGCKHTLARSASASHHIGQSWYDYQICPCCALELVELGDINHPQVGFYQQSHSCNRKIREELERLKAEEEPKKRTPEQEEKYRQLMSMRKRRYMRLIR